MYSQNKQMQTVKLEGTHLQRVLHVKKTNKRQNRVEKTAIETKNCIKHKEDSIIKYKSKVQD